MDEHIHLSMLPPLAPLKQNKKSTETKKQKRKAKKANFCTSSEDTKRLFNLHLKKKNLA